ncbi:MAG: hypothetical protein A2X94_15875 [Bdellovibrionales bacterium GWB1_55_8]|nr:MAG: hypothetical protein A2X94_15875 [Bdellovibrionales bacterium GWB1_55_8]
MHWAAKRALEARGYRWELRRKGELKLGVLRKSWIKPGHKRSSELGIRRLVILPGLGDSPLSWIPVFGLAQAAVRRSYDEIVYVDFPGFSGFLAQERSFHSMDLLLDAVFDLLDSLKPDTVLGHSLGGWIAALYAAECGKGVRPLSPSGKKMDYEGPRRMLLVLPAGLFEDQSQRERWQDSIAQFMTDEAGAEWRSHAFHREPLWFRWVAADARQFLARDDVRQFLKSVRDEHYLDARIPEIRSETALLWTEHDRLLPLSVGEYWMRRIPNTIHHAILLKGVGHSPHLENPVAIASVLSRLISSKKPHRWSSRWWVQLNSTR